MYRQLLVTPKPVSPQKFNLQSQTGIVTGSNVGLGIECCRQLLDLGLDHLILAVRNEDKGRKAKEDLQKGTPGAKIEVWKLDLSTYDSVTAFAQRCNTLSRLQFVILNAGVFKVKLEINESTSHEEVMQVNYPSTALLTNLLLPILKERNTPAHPGRITIVSSETAAWCKFKEQEPNPILPAFNDPKNFEKQERYYTSKLLEQLFLVQLAKRVPSSVAVVNCVNPGFCYGSNLHHEAAVGVVGAIFTGIKRTIGRSTEVGARSLTDAAVNHGSETHGKYLGDCQIKPQVQHAFALSSTLLTSCGMAPFVTSPKGDSVGERLWNETMAELSFARAQETLNDLKR